MARFRRAARAAAANTVRRLPAMRRRHAGARPPSGVGCGATRAGLRRVAATPRGVAGGHSALPADAPARVAGGRGSDAQPLGFLRSAYVGVLANAAATGALSGPHDRYGARMAWLLPLSAPLAWWPRRGVAGLGGAGRAVRAEAAAP